MAWKITTEAMAAISQSRLKGVSQHAFMAGPEKQLSHGKAWLPKIHSMPTTESIPGTRLAEQTGRILGAARVEIVVPVRNRRA